MTEVNNSIPELHPERYGGRYAPELVAENIHNLAEVLPYAMKIAGNRDLQNLIEAVRHLGKVAEAAYEAEQHLS